MFRKKVRHAGIVEIDVELLLKIFDLEGGELHDIHMRDGCLPHKIIQLVIEHPDFPKVGRHEPLEHVIIAHQATYGENGVPIKIERVNPPKRNAVEKIKSQSPYRKK